MYAFEGGGNSAIAAITYVSSSFLGFSLLLLCNVVSHLTSQLFLLFAGIDFCIFVLKHKIISVTFLCSICLYTAKCDKLDMLSCKKIQAGCISS